MVSPLQGSLVACALLFVAGITSAETRHNAPVSDAEVIKDPGFSNELFLAQADHVYLAGQPNAADLAHFKRLGVTTVVNLRHADEMDWDEAAAVRGLGLVYYQVPVVADEALQPAALDLVDELLEASGQQIVLLHCRSGNRAAAWWARHLVKVHNMPTQAALRLAGRAGLTHKPLAENVQTLVN